MIFTFTKNYEQIKLKKCHATVEFRIFCPPAIERKFEICKTRFYLLRNLVPLKRQSLEVFGNNMVRIFGPIRQEVIAVLWSYSFAYVDEADRSCLYINFPNFRTPSNAPLSREPEQHSRHSDWLRGGRPRGRSSSPGRVFSTSSRLALGPTQPPIQWVLGAPSPGVKRQAREADHSTSN
jgi:hypothetical protein